MTDRARRRELRDEAQRHPPEAGVYAIRHRATGRVLVTATQNLAGARNLFAFAVTTGSLGVLDGQLAGDIREHGAEGLELEVLETVAVEPGTPLDELRSDLRTLEALWREKLGV
jgi:broad specificity phosphatase PhoE